MPKTQLNCPNCQQPIVADVEQLFDVAQNPQAKQALLTGVFNMADCPHCGYQGNLATPIVYHDPEKELLLTFFPPELNLPRDEQERIIGPLITKVVDSLPQEQRKGYLFSPKTMLTHKGLVETILEADGITKEMIEEQEERMALMQRLMAASPESQAEIIKQEAELIDEQFFALFSRLADVALMGDDQSVAQQLKQLQDSLMEHSEIGQGIKAEAEEFQTAQKALEELGSDLTREKLLELVIAAPNDSRLNAYVQMARPGMDYEFFQMLSEKIDLAEGDQEQKLLDLREKLLTATSQIDAAIEQRMELTRRNLETLLQAEDIAAATKANLAAIDEFFLQVLTEALDAAREAGDLDRSSKLQQIMSVIEEQTATPPEYELLDELVAIADDDDALLQSLNSQADEVRNKLIEIMAGLLTQLQASFEKAGDSVPPEQREMFDRVEKVYSLALKLSMEKSFKA